MRTRQQLVASRSKTNSGTNDRRYITIHETANPGLGANAAAHANLQSRGNVRQASWHWQVDDKEAVQSFPHTVRCWHAGDGAGPGNNGSIGIEICVNRDGDFGEAVRNAAALARQIAKDEGIPYSRIVQHNHWSGKNCPTNLRNGSKGVTWVQFLDLVHAGKVQQVVDKVVGGVKQQTNKRKSTNQLAREVMAGKHGNGPARRRSLGSRYAEVQAEVNRILGLPQPSAPAPKTTAQLAREVIDGKHGVGPTRKRSLGSRYAEVQREVNRILTGSSRPARKPAGKSVSQMASEVLAGKHGNGHEARRRSLGVSNAVYQKVRAEVNRRAR